MGCATVDPRPDFAQVGEMAATRGVGGELYDPALEAEVDQRIEALLADGLTLDEVIQIALLNNKALQGKFAELGVARSELVQSGLLTNPVLTLAAQLPEAGGRANLTVGIGQEIADLWQIPLRKKIAQAELERMILDTARTAISLAADIEAQLYRTVALEQSAALLERIAESQRQRVEVDRQRVAVGEAGIADLNEAQLGLYQFEFQLAGIRRELQMNRLALFRMMGISQRGNEVAIHAVLPDPLERSINDVALLQEAISDRLDVRAAAESVAGARAEVERQKRRLFPSLMVGIESERMERRAMPDRDIPADTVRASAAQGALTAPEVELPSQRDKARRQEIDFMIGPSLAVPLPVWDQNQAQFAIAWYRLRQRQKELEDLEDRVAFEVRTALALLSNAQQQARIYRDQILPLARSGVGLARARLQAGVQGIAVVLSADQAALALEREYISAQRDYGIALTELDRAVGRRLRAAGSPASEKKQAVTPED